MARRSERIKSRIETDGHQAVTSSSPEDALVDSTLKQSAVTARPARASTKRRVVQRKRGSLRSMLKMPLDILIEVSLTSIVSAASLVRLIIDRH